MPHFTIGYGMIPTASPEEIRQAVGEIAPEYIDARMGDYAKKTELNSAIDDVNSTIGDMQTTMTGIQTTVDSKIDGTDAQSLIDTAFSTAESQGKMNDIREFDSFDKFPGNDPTKPEDKPIPGVEYVDLETDYEYIWEGNYDEHDKPIYVRVKDNEPLEDNAIESIFTEV